MECSIKPDCRNALQNLEIVFKIQVVEHAWFRDFINSLIVSTFVEVKVELALVGCKSEKLDKSLVSKQSFFRMRAQIYMKNFAIIESGFYLSCGLHAP